MSTNPLHTILITTATIGLAAVLALATTNRERSAARAPQAYGLLQVDGGFRSR